MQMSAHPSLKSPFSPSTLFYRQLFGIGVCLLLASAIYFTASNWFYLAHGIRMAIPMLVMLITSMISLLPSVNERFRQMLHFIAVVMIGLSLAVIGQAYQTGANSFWLFGIWSVLATLWLYRHNVWVFCLTVAISELALWLFFEQNYIRQDQVAFFVSINALTAFWLWAMARLYPSARFLITAIILAIAMMSALTASDMIHLNTAQGLVAISSMVLLPMLAVRHFRQVADSVCVTLNLSGMAAAILAWFMLTAFDWADSGFVWGLVAFVWFGAVGWLVYRLFPQGKFHAVPVGVGAYLAGVLFAAATLTLWLGGAMWLGVGFLAFTIILLSKLQDSRRLSTLFVRHFAYAMMLAGQAAFLFGLYERTDSVLWLLIAQATFAIYVPFLSVHWLIKLGQWLALYAIACVYFAQEFTESAFVLHAVCLALVALMAMMTYGLHDKIPKALPKRTFWLYLLATTSITYAAESLSVHGTHILPQSHRPMSVLVLQLAFAIGFGYFMKLYQRQNWLMSVLFIALILLGQFELAVLIVGLMWASSHQDRLVNGLYLLGIGVFLWHTYYALSLSFLAKSLAMAVAGIVVIIIASLPRFYSPMIQDNK